MSGWRSGIAFARRSRALSANRNWDHFFGGFRLVYMCGASMDHR